MVIGWDKEGCYCTRTGICSVELLKYILQ